MKTRTADNGVRITEWADSRAAAWDRFVYSSPAASFFHLYGWRQMLASILGRETHYLCAEQDGTIAGVLPLFHTKSRLFGHYLSSPPGGLCTEDPETAAALVERAKQLTVELGADYLILRDGQRSWQLPELEANDSQCTLVANVSPDLDAVWQEVHNEERRVLKKARKKGVVVTTSPDCLETFYPLYLAAMRTRGTPPHSLKFFKLLRELFPDHFLLQMVSIEDDVFAGGLIVPFKDTLFCTWAAIQPAHYHLRPSHLLLWQALAFAGESGLAQVDFGRSQQGSGSYNFKRKWGAAPRPIYQYFFLNRASAPPAVGQEHTEDPRFRLLTSVWGRLPLAMTQVVGAQIRKRIPFG